MSIEYKISGNTLQVQTPYEDFGSFMEETRDPVYRTIASAFKELHEKDMVTVTVRAARVENIEFESVLEFSKSTMHILTDIIIPYFESIEDYEMCGEVLELYNSLVRK